MAELGPTDINKCNMLVLALRLAELRKPLADRLVLFCQKIFLCGHYSSAGASCRVQACAAADMCQSTPNRDAVAKYEYVFVLHGKQGKNKTKFFNQLLPKEMNEYIKDGVSIDPSSRDSVWRALGFWLVELGELDTTFRRADMSALKAFLSEQMDKMRLPYGRAFMKFKRQTVFAGSVNDMEFLRDSTGNRRYWPVTAVKIRLPIECGLDINKVWAEAWKLYQDGAQWWPSEAQEEIIERIRITNFEDRPLSAIEERLSELYPDLSPEIKDIYGTERLRASDLMVTLDIIAPTKNEFKDLKNWMMRRNTKPDGTPDYINHQTTHWVLPLPPIDPEIEFRDLIDRAA
jgi:predicted P-loop ATPase